MTAPIPIIIVAFGNPEDVIRCIEALSGIDPLPATSIHVCENGGVEAMNALLQALTAPDGPCRRVALTGVVPARMRRVVQLRFADGAAPPIPIQIGEARENLGYAGGVNAWLEALVTGDWPGAWILNPDTKPEAAALVELVEAAERTGAGILGSRLVAPGRPEETVACGLRWRRWRAATANISSEDADFVRRTVEAPSGASLYVTRACIEGAGLMEEKYFLYFEDLEWGLRAKPFGGVSYAERSIVTHAFGTTIGSATSRRQVSPLSVYLDFRNRLIFVRRNFPRWFTWTVLVEIAELAMYLRLRAWSNAAAALHGLAAGIHGLSGRPDDMLAKHLARKTLGYRYRLGSMKRRAKLAISLIYFALVTTARAFAGGVGLSISSRLQILCYHGIRPEQQLNFARQMHALKNWANVVGADWQGGLEARPHRPLVALTFDDAFESLHENALSLLEQLDLPCTIFAPTAYFGTPPRWRMETSADRVEQVMTASRLAQLDGSLVTIGSHSVTHPHLTSLSREDARKEFEGSRAALETLLQRPISLFAFPYGDYNADMVALCQECGYRHAFTVEPTPVRPGDASVTRGRVVVDPEDGPIAFYLKVHGAYAWMAPASAFKRAVMRRLRPNARPWHLNPMDEC